MGDFFPLRNKRRPYQWAQEERWIAQGASPLSQHGPIRYDGSRMPWCEEPQNEAVSPDVQITVLLWAAAMAKTECVVNVIGQSIAEEPKNIIIAYPNEAARDKFSRDVLQRSLIDATPAIRSLVVEQKSRDSGNTIAYKRFAGGSLNAIAAGSASNFRGPRAGLAYGDEIDAMPGSVGVEGDPVGLLFKRCEGFASSIKMLSGTPTLKGYVDHEGRQVWRSRIQYWLDQSDCRKWFVPCRSCGVRQVLMWPQVRAPKDNPEAAVYLCEHCDAAHDDRQRIEMVMNGVWRPTQAYSGIRGYWLNGLNSTLPPEKGFKTKLHQFVVDADRAQNGMDATHSKRVWVNTFLAECDDPAGETEPPPDWQLIYQRREDYSTPERTIVPREVLVLTAAVDVQSDRLEVEWEGRGRGEDSWGIRHHRIYGPVKDAGVWRELRRELQREFEHASGKKIALGLCLIDGGKWGDRVFDFLKEGSMEGRVRACRGSSQYPHPIVAFAWSTLAKQLKGHWVGGDAAKDLIYSQLRMIEETDGSKPDGWRHYPKSYGEEFFRQLMAERVSVTFDRGEEKRRYLNAEKARNEALDLSVYNLAAWRLGLWQKRWDFDAIEAAFAGETEQQEAKLRATVAPAVRMRSKGFVGRF